MIERPYDKGPRANIVGTMSFRMPTTGEMALNAADVAARKAGELSITAVNKFAEASADMARYMLNCLVYTFDQVADKVYGDKEADNSWMREL